MTVRTRIAPSPTGFPHIGTMYQALFDYAYAKKYNGKFAIRIEDTDRARYVEGAEEALYKAFDWFALTEDESPRKGGDVGPYRQSQRLDIYQKYLQELYQKEGAYFCFCTKERLDQLRKEQQEQKKPTMYDRFCRDLPRDDVKQKLDAGVSWAFRLKVPRNTTIIVKDEIRGDISFHSETIEDAILIKADGYPTYHFANVVDDHLMNITHVLRGEEWIPSFPKHWLLYEYFGWEKPLFFHAPLLRNPDKTKLSKRHGHTNVVWYQQEGFLPEAILNFLALMGWSHPEGKEIFSLEEFIRVVELKDLKAVGPVFDVEKLKWINGEYIRNLSDEDFKKRLIEFDPSIKELENNDLLISLAKTRMKTLKDFKELTAEPLEKPLFSEEEKKTAEKLVVSLSHISEWKSDVLLTTLKNVKDQQGISMKTIYYLIMHKKQGLPLMEYMEMQGKEKIVNKLRELSLY